MDENQSMAPPATTAERCVLIVEDSENSAATIEMALLGVPGVSLVLVRSAREALRVLDRPEASVHAVITDLNMPYMDGFELIERIRADRRNRALPVIVVSADTHPETPERVAQLQVAAFFTKPFSPAAVRRKVEQLLNVTTP